MYWLLQIAPIILPLTNDMRTMRNMGPPVAPSVSPPFAMKRANSDAFAFAITRVAIMDAQLWTFKDVEVSLVPFVSLAKILIFTRVTINGASMLWNF